MSSWGIVPGLSLQVPGVLISSYSLEPVARIKNKKRMHMKRIIWAFAALLIYPAAGGQQPAVPSQHERDGITYMREEEKMARDVYDSMYAKWNMNPFGNIRRSEQMHMDRMKALIEAYKLADPVVANNDKPGIFSNTTLQRFYNEFVATGSQSLANALKVGARIEELDISDLEERKTKTGREDIISVYNYLIMASENHLRAFVRRLQREGVDYKPVILGKDRFDEIISSGTRGGGMRGRWN